MVVFSIFFIDLSIFQVLALIMSLEMNSMSPWLIGILMRRYALSLLTIALQTIVQFLILLGRLARANFWLMGISYTCVVVLIS